MNTAAQTIFAATIATFAFAASASANDSAVAVLGSTDAELTIDGEFSMAMWVEVGEQDGFIAGNPGRASLAIENGEFIFTVGGEDEIAGIYRESYEVGATAPAAGWTHVAATLASDGIMTLAVSNGNGETSLSMSRSDMDLFAQLTIMEELIGDVTCSETFFVGDAPQKCVPSDGNSDANVEDAAVYSYVLTADRLVPVPDC